MIINLLNSKFGIQLDKKGSGLSHQPIIKEQMELLWSMILLNSHH